MAKKHGVCDVTIHAWRKRYGQLEPVEVRRLRQREQENAKLKKQGAERGHEIAVMKEVAEEEIVSAQARRLQVAMMERGQFEPTSKRADVGFQINPVVRTQVG